MLRIIASVLIALTFLAAPSAAIAAKRVALVIGNDNYPNLDADAQLLKARNDARASAETLERLGFTVRMGLDLDRSAMNLELQKFANDIAPGDTAAFFFAGHGVRIDGRNFLLPTDVPAIETGQESFLMSESIRVDEIADMISATGARFSLLVLDACRDNPFTDNRGRSIGGDRGLAISVPPEGMMIIYSAGANQKALDRLNDADPHPNSVFTRTFLPLIAREGMELSALSRLVKEEVRDLAQSVRVIQIPAVYNEIIGDVYLAGRGDDGSSRRPAPPETADPAAEVWDAIAETTSRAVLEAFIKQFPNSVYATFARARVDEIERRETEEKSAALPKVDPRNRAKLTGSYKPLEGGWAEGEMEIRTNLDGSQNFSAEVWFENGHSCAIAGTAVAIDSGWRYMDGAECVLELRAESDKVVSFSVEPTSPCRDYCGNAGNLDRLKFFRSK